MRVFEGVTIDPPGSRDLDDAIYVARDADGWLVSVAFPRLVDLVPFAEADDAAAFAAAFTRYRGPSVSKPMLPSATCHEASLTPDRDHDAFLVEVRLDADLVPSPAAVTRVSCRTVARLTYSGADALVRSGDGGPVVDMLAEANALARALAAKRLASGSIGFVDVGRGDATDEEGHAVHAPWSGHWANAVVRETMVLANASLAKLCASAGLPILYRNHRASPVASREAIVGDIALSRSGALGFDALTERLALVIGRATLGPKVEGHFGLNLAAYAWFTSPLRRYADLVNQRALEAHLLGEPAPYDPVALGMIGTALDAKLAQEREGKSVHFRESVATAAEDAIAAGTVTAFPADRFGAVVKAATVGGMMTEQVASELRSRLDAGTLTAKECARMLLHGGELAKDVAARLVANPNEALGIVNYGVQALGWPEVAYVEKTSPAPAGNGHVFSCVATLVVDGTTNVSPPCAATTIKAARHQATARVVAALAGVSLPSPAPSEPAVAPRKVARAPVDASARNRLQEYCQARKLAMPTFEVQASGPPHAPTFDAVACVVIGGQVRHSPSCQGPTRKAAEAAAAQALLRSLGR